MTEKKKIILKRTSEITNRSNLNIVLIHPYTQVPPFGIMSIASVLEKNGFNVKIVDYDYENVSPKTVLNDIKGADLIGISTYTMPMLKEAVHITRVIKKHSKAFLVWGGVHATLFPKNSLDEFDLDAVVVNEGEFTLLEVAKSLRDKKPIDQVKGLHIKKDGNIVFTGLRDHIFDMKTLPPYAWHLINPEKYTSINLITKRKSILLIESRGCPYNCSFCYVNDMFGRRWRGRTPEEVVEELNYLSKNYGITHFDFLDDLPYGGRKEEMLKFCNMIMDKNYTWTCDYRVNCADYEVLKAMKKSGCKYIYYGVESGSIKVLNLLRKGTNPEIIIKAFRLTNKVGINCMAGFISGFPGENKNDLILTFKLAKKIKATKYRLAKYVPYPGGDLYEMALKRGFRLPKKTMGFAYMGDYKKGNLNLSTIPDSLFFKYKRKIEFMTIPNSIKFAFKHNEFVFLPYFIIDTLPGWLSKIIIVSMRIITAPIKLFLSKKTRIIKQ
jgi:anaerobic magnesium-protoporphyrin IX monomethyl ester cyclase